MCKGIERRADGVFSRQRARVRGVEEGYLRVREGCVKGLLFLPVCEGEDGVGIGLTSRSCRRRNADDGEGGLQRCHVKDFIGRDVVRRVCGDGLAAVHDRAATDGDQEIRSAFLAECAAAVAGHDGGIFGNIRKDGIGDACFVQHRGDVVECAAGLGTALTGNDERRFAETKGRGVCLDGTEARNQLRRKEKVEFHNCR